MTSHRLFQVSTLDAAMTGNLSGVEGFTSTSDQEQLNRIERQIKRRFVVGSQVRYKSYFSKLMYNNLSQFYTD